MGRIYRVVPAELLPDRDLGLVNFVEQLKLNFAARDGFQFAFVQAKLDMAVGEAGIDVDNALVTRLSTRVDCCQRVGAEGGGGGTHRHFGRKSVGVEGT